MFIPFMACFPFAVSVAFLEGDCRAREKADNENEKMTGDVDGRERATSRIRGMIGVAVCRGLLKEIG
jgi:hypothetical protein